MTASATWQKENVKVPPARHIDGDDVAQKSNEGSLPRASLNREVSPFRGFPGPEDGPAKIDPERRLTWRKDRKNASMVRGASTSARATDAGPGSSRTIRSQPVRSVTYMARPRRKPSGGSGRRWPEQKQESYPGLVRLPWGS